MTSTTSAPRVVRVGVGVLVKDPRQPHKILAGIRKGSHGAKTLALPGGHLEMNETWEQCAIREVLEETGLHIHNVEFAHVTNDIMTTEQKHYITIFMKGECVDSNAVAENLEPHKCEGWDSFSWEELRDILTAQKDDVDPQVLHPNTKESFRANGLFLPLEHIVCDSPESVIRFLQS